MISALDKAREAYKKDADYRHEQPVLGGAINLVLDRPEGEDSYISLFALAEQPEVSVLIGFMVASVTGILDEKGEEIVDDEGTALDYIEVASAITGAKITEPREAMAVFFTSGTPPKLDRYRLTDVVMIHRTILMSGGIDAINAVPEA
ncbi:MAG TPA: hypothetical protein VMF31_03285 [Solirubrobacterales bacterium]|nr:hypothetical protein [Solirubrobacterales bacterium]